jgi:hypothetical protein
MLMIKRPQFYFFSHFILPVFALVRDDFSHVGGSLGFIKPPLFSLKNYCVYQGQNMRGLQLI